MINEIDIIACPLISGSWLINAEGHVVGCACGLIRDCIGSGAQSEHEKSVIHWIMVDASTEVLVLGTRNQINAS
jgi:hypothetical protein